MPTSAITRIASVSTRNRPKLIFGGLAALSLGGCSTASRSGNANDGRLRITATTGQVGDLIRNVGGERVDVTTLMGAGVDPHLFKASERNVEDLIDSEAIFYNGLHLEGKLGEVLEQVARRRLVVAVGEGVPHDLLETPPDFEGNPDPHIWFDPTLWMHCVERAAASLTELAPELGDAVAVNAERYLQELAEVHAYAQEQFATIPDQQRVLVTAHDAFGYLGRQYDIEVVGLQGISTSTEAGVRDVQRIADLLVERKVPTIFVETSVPRRTIESVQVATDDRGWTVSIGRPLYSDALGDEGTIEGTYIGMFRYDVDAIVSGLKGVSE